MREAWKITREMFLSNEEAQQLLTTVRNAARDARGDQKHTALLDRLIVECLLYSGLRSTEFCRLRVCDTKVGTGESAFEVHTDKESRNVCVPARVSQLVERYVDQIRPALLPDDMDPADLAQPLVIHERRAPYERTGLYRRVVRILTAAGLGSRASVQLLRHTYGYLAYGASGGNLLFVQRQLGHAHPMVTSVYAQFFDEDYFQLADQIYGSPKSQRGKRTGRRTR